MTLDTWLLFVALSILPAFSPGPGLLFTLSNSLRYGSRITFWSALGNTLGMVIIGAGVTFGLGALMAASSVAFLALKIIGGLYLVWLGIKTWRDRSELEADLSLALPPKRRSIFLTALGVAITNPKAIAVQLAIIPPFLHEPSTLYRDGLILAVTYALACLVSHISVMLLSGRLRGFFANALRMKYLRRGIGLTFISFGAALAASSR
ncbi:Threonine/homoserine/homoserine lactone efflux protein [Cohaesibacter sp. ES.047]|uniref:LysE family translocator n=1 Tax=Cohaesibacter sp. ES.047 TaxID=1798205 RepID=UPI000BB97FDC|nr:LysE family translocator [Cohaesibacter sp. ES.047]SNY93818.1 Threonine/homoserine/homoserine lactone efflux protein [Cohaesibacter sp. ES.047]